MRNKNLHAAKRNKKDEFYTQLTDIEAELRHYRDHFKGKEVYCNCDNPRVSAFWKYFSLNFEFLGLKKLIATCYLVSLGLRPRLAFEGIESGLHHHGRQPSSAVTDHALLLRGSNSAA